MIPKRIAKFIIISVMIVFAAVNDVLACSSKPVAEFECTSDSVQCHAGTFQFDAGDSYDPDGGNITDYEWTYPEEATNIQGQGSKNFSCSFSEPGAYYIELRVKDDEGDWSENECWDLVGSVQINGLGEGPLNWPLEWMDTYPPTFGIDAIGPAGPLVQSWSGGGDPATQQGGATFTTAWYETGKYTVTVNTDCGSFSKDVYVFDLDLIVEDLTEEEEMDPGKDILVNNDDDDSNSVPDFSDSGPVADEDDLVELTLSIVPELQSGTVTFTAGSSNGGEVRLWLSEEKGTELTATSFDLSQESLPEKIYAEGCAAGEVVLWFYYGYIFDQDWALLNIEQPDCAHPINFAISTCSPMSNQLYYGLDVIYGW